MGYLLDRVGVVPCDADTVILNVTLVGGNRVSSIGEGLEFLPSMKWRFLCIRGVCGVAGGSG